MLTDTFCPDILYPTSEESKVLTKFGNFALLHLSGIKTMTTQTNNTNDLNTTILAIAAQATKLTGERQEGLALTKFHTALEEGKIVFDGTTDNFTVNGTAQNTNVAIAAFYAQAFDNKTGLDIPTLIKFSQAGVVSAKQLACLESETKPAVKKPLPGHVQTSAEYLQGAFLLASNPEVIGQIYNLLKDLKDSSTKADILLVKDAALALILTPEKAAGLQNLIEKEEAFAKRFEALSVYFTDIISSCTATSGKVAADNIKPAVELLTSNGYELFGTPILDMTTTPYTFKVSFREISTENDI